MRLWTFSISRFCCALLCLRAPAVASANKKPTVILAGGTGNLAQKYLWQQLFDLYQERRVGRIITGATKPVDIGKPIIDQIIQKKVSCDTKSNKKTCGKDFQEFQRIVEYMQLKKENNYIDLGRALNNENESESGRLFFLSVSPDFYPSIAKYINLHCRPLDKPASRPWLRVIFEKPFGRDLASAKDLAEQLSAELAEEEILRVDHYLGKAAVQAVVQFRASNSQVWASMFNSKFLSKIVVGMRETEDCEGRTGFYDHYGVIRDVLQNHLSEILAMIAGDIDPATGNVNRSAILRHVRATKHEVAQYAGYKQHVMEDRVKYGDKSEQETTTATAARVNLAIDTPTWRGTAVELFAGKAMAMREAYALLKPREKFAGCDMVFYFQGKRFARPAFVWPVDRDKCQSNLERAGKYGSLLQHLESVVLPQGWKLDENQHNVAMMQSSPENPYRKLIREALSGNQANFCDTSELMELWRIWTPVCRAESAAGQTDLQTYKKGENFPEHAYTLDDELKSLKHGLIHEEL